MVFINWDHTGIHYFPAGTRKMEKMGGITGTGNTKQFIAVLGITLPYLRRSFLSRKCLAIVKFPSNWHLTFTEDYWANELTTYPLVHRCNSLLHKKQKRRELKLHNQPSLVIFEYFKAQCTSIVLEVLEENMFLFL